MGGDLSNTDKDNPTPQIQWNGSVCTVTLPMAGGGDLTAEWKPKTTYITRIRKAGSEDWSVGFETPVGGGTFRWLEPDTEYEVELTVRDPVAEVLPAYARFRTGPAGEGGEVIPFPKT